VYLPRFPFLIAVSLSLLKQLAKGYVLRGQDQSGGFFIVGHSDNKSPAGDFKIMAVLGYDPETKMYTYNAFDSWGELITAKGNVSGNTWTWITVTMMQGKPMKTRLTEKEVSKTQYTLKYESSTDDGNTWTSDMESTFTRVAAIP
jgi:hypothetical protein